MSLPPISTRDPSRLPAPAELKRLCQSLALLDALVSPQWEARTYSFRARWSEIEALASMRSGSGDGYFVLFSPAGAVIKGFAHESPMASYPLTHGRPWPGVLDALPPQYGELLSDPAFSVRDATFCLWRGNDDPAWSVGPVAFPPADDPDGSASLLSLLDGRPETYCAWAQEYYEARLDERAVAQVYRHEPLTNDLIALFNPKASLHSLADALDEIGYPRA